MALATIGVEVAARKRGRIYGLDMIRGAAVFLVLMRHAWPGAFGGAGIVGVVMFFALSGYLITGILTRELAQTGCINFKRFYIHRFYRLLPPLLALITVYTVVQATMGLFGDKDSILRVWVVSLTYTANLPFWSGSDAIGHLWTLATEEQFYLIWPFVLVFAYRVRRLKAVLLSAIAFAMVVCVVSVIFAAPDVERIYMLPTSWAVSILIGALGSVYKDQLFRLMPSGVVAQSGFAFAASVGLLAISISPGLKQSAATYILLGPLIAVLTLVLVVRAESASKRPSWVEPIVALGTISYAAYLWNYPVAQVFGESPLGLLPGLASMAVTILLAIISWWAVERPAAKLRRRFAAFD